MLTAIKLQNNVITASSKETINWVIIKSRSIAIIDDNIKQGYDNDANGSVTRHNWTRESA